MSLVLIFALIAVAVSNGKLRKALKEERTRSRMLTQGEVSGIGYSAEFIGQEAETLRRAAECALRTKAESLLPKYEQSGLVRDLLVKIQEAISYDDVLWDVELNDNEVILTTMTDSMENRLVLVREFYEFRELGYEAPSRESCHRLALALALQKGLGSGYGINYQFRYNPVDDSHVLSHLVVSYRKKQGMGVALKSPLDEWQATVEEEPIPKQKLQRARSLFDE